VSSARPNPLSSPSDFPVRLALFALLALAALLPPEARGESMTGCALLVLLAVGLQSARGAWGERTAHGLLVGGGVLAILAARAARAPGAAVEPVSVVVLAAAVGIAAAGLQGGERARCQGLRLLGAAAVAVSLHALYQKLFGLERLRQLLEGAQDLPDRAAVLAKLEGGRAFAGFITPAALGGFLLLSLPLSASLALATRGTRRVAWVVACVLQLGAFLAAASATAAGALLATTALALLVWSRRRQTLLAGLALLALILAAVAVQREGIVLDPTDPKGPWQERAGNFRAAWEMAAEHPWIGVGPGGFSELYPGYRRPGDNETRHVHNLPLELSAELGWPAGLLLAALFFTLFCRPLWTERRAGPAWRKGLAIGLAAFALHNLGDFSAYMPSLIWIAALLLGLLSAPQRPEGPTSRSGLRAALAGAAMVAVVLAGSAAALAGLASDHRLEARYLSFAGERGRALERAGAAARLAPWDVDAALLLARATEAALDDRQLALERAERAVTLSPVRPAARLLRGRLRLATGDLEGAHADFVEAARLYPLEASYAAQRDLLRAELKKWVASDGQRGLP
jgi:tetratricopeptide (TPR) repeat protein